MAMPVVVKENPIYSKIWNDVYENAMSATILIIGNVGKGKSTTAITIASALDQSFTAERICFSVEEMLKLISEGNLKRGSALILDEAAGSEDAADSRNAMSKTNKTISYFTTIGRQMGLIIFYVCPMLSQLDKRLRLIGVSAVIVMKKIDRQNKLAETNFHWCHLSPMTGKVLMPYPRMIINGKCTMMNPVYFHYPTNVELVKEYREKKDAFISGSVSRWYNQFVDRKTNKKATAKVDIPKLAKIVEKDRDSFVSAGGISVALLRGRFGIGKDSARHLQAYLNAPKQQ